MVAHTLIPALRKQRQADLCEVEASLVYRSSSRIAGLHRENLVWKKKQNQKKRKEKQANKTKTKTRNGQYRSSMWLLHQEGETPPPA